MTLVKERSVIEEASGVIQQVDLAAIRTAVSGYEQRLADYLLAAKPDATSVDLLGWRSIRAAEPPVLAGSLPYQVVAAGLRASTLPASLRHSVTISLYASTLDQSLESPQLEHRLSLPTLNLRRLGVTYVPASQDDAALMQNAASSGARSLPAYLIRVRPQLRLDGDVLAEGPVAVMAQPQIWQATLSSPTRGVQPVAFTTPLAGDELVFSINGGGIDGRTAFQRLAAVDPSSAAENLHLSGLAYWAAHDGFDELAASAYGVRSVRLPSVALVAAGLRASFFFGIPRQASYVGRQLDARLVSLSAVSEDARARRAFLIQAGIQGSQWEASSFNTLFERPQGVGLSATEFLAYAAKLSIPIHAITAQNVESILPSLTTTEEVRADIRAAVSTGRIAIVPQRDVTANGQTGIGYILLDPQTGEGAYLVDGGLNGGMQPGCSPGVQPPASNVSPSLAFFTGGPFIPFTDKAINAAVASEIEKRAAATAGRTLLSRLIPMITTRIIGNGITIAVAEVLLLNPVLAVALSLAIIFVLYEVKLALIEAGYEFGSATDVDTEESDCECKPDPKPAECQCTFTPVCPHLGGDQIHNTCADEIPPNVYPECDVLVTPPNGQGKRFDAMSADGTLWEFKTDRYSRHNPFIQGRIIDDDFKDGATESGIARQCGRNYNYVVADRAHYEELLRRQFNEIPTQLLLETGCLSP